MMLRIIFTAVILASICLLGSLEARVAKIGEKGYDFSYYSDDGPFQWKTMFPEFCAGNSQSPIDITYSIIKKEKIGRLKVTGYNQNYPNLTITNTGNTIRIIIPEDSGILLSEGGLPGKFKLVQINFHWGRDINSGSEHLLFGQKYPLEMQLVHRNVKYSADEPLRKPDSVAILSTLFTVSLSNNYDLQTITSTLPKLQHFNSSTTISNFKLEDLLPYNYYNKYYRYHGSLTTPNCAEVVTWTVFHTKKDIGLGQLAAFRTVMDKRNRPLVDNFRYEKSSIGREVLLNDY